MTHKTKPFSLRLTEAERRALESRAASMSVSAYVRARLFEAEETPRRTRGRFPVADHAALAQVLGQLGRSEIADNLGSLAEAARSGVLPLTPETAAALQAAHREVLAMKRLLMTALGIREH